MTVTINPGIAHGTVAAPPSKSMAHRALICGAMTDGSTVRGVSMSRDIKATLSCLGSLGANVEIKDGTVSVGGLCSRQSLRAAELFCDESGSTLRFLIPLCLLSKNKTVFSGSERLFARPLGEYADICKEKRLLFLQEKDRLTVKGSLEDGNFTVRGDISSQFISGLLFALPMLPFGGSVRISTPTESRSYIDMTVSALENFGVCVQQTDSLIKIPAGQEYRPADITVEGDCSNAAFFEALCVLGGDVTVTGINHNTVQGDRVYKELITKLCSGNFETDITDCPDLAPVLFAVAAAKHGAVFTGTRRLRFKESDRTAAMKEELEKFGVNIIVEENRVTVPGGCLSAPTTVLSSHNDHRIAMSLAVLCTITGGTIEGAEAVDKSFPDFFKKISSLGIELRCKNGAL